jgi:RimJ/RimL family protein N-acetyltransferase
MNTPAAAPVLETQRLRLRPHAPADLDASVEMWSDPVVVRFIGGNKLPRQQVWSRLLAYAGHWALMGFGYWAVEEKETDAFIGEVGFADFKRDIVPSLEGAPELGWALASSAHGKGFATEALRAVISWGDGRFAKGRTACLIDPGNVASLRVAQKCGYEEFARTVYKDEPTILFERLSSGSK